MDCIFEEDSEITEAGFEERILKELEEFSDDDNTSMNISNQSIRLVNTNIGKYI